MGRNKLLLELDGETLVHRAARRAIDAGLDPVVVVVGHEGDAVRAAVGDLPVETVANPDFTGPTSTSLCAGIEVLGDDADGAIVILGDMVRVTPEMLRSVAERVAAKGVLGAMSRYGNVVAPPHGFARDLFVELLQWPAAGAGRGVLALHADRVDTLDWPEDALADVDTPDDYDRAKA